MPTYTIQNQSYQVGTYLSLKGFIIVVRWTDNLRFYVIFNSILVISRGDNERLCAMEPPLRLERFQHLEGNISRLMMQLAGSKGQNK